ncbi:nmrA-like family domain-containing protein 1 [Candoia aspera]|uniref:nmrA-like family domain-containing protein 1 n=1 Tax=Candoia aspera TaxID=51853 RepID=UPI002FD7CA7F
MTRLGVPPAAALPHTRPRGRGPPADRLSPRRGPGRLRGEGPARRRRFPGGCAGAAEVVQADLEDASSLEAVLRGASGVFLVTDFWEHLSKKREVAQGKCMADLAKQLGLNYVVYSSLDNLQKLTSGQLKVPRFDGKGEVEEYFQAVGVPMTSVRLSSYFENFLTTF